jgi:hypothetical protein
MVKESSVLRVIGKPKILFLRRNSYWVIKIVEDPRPSDPREAFASGIREAFLEEIRYSVTFLL